MNSRLLDDDYGVHDTMEINSLREGTILDFLIKLNERSDTTPSQGMKIKGKKGRKTNFLHTQTPRKKYFTNSIRDYLISILLLPNIDECFYPEDITLQNTILSYLHNHGYSTTLKQLFAWVKNYNSRKIRKLWHEKNRPRVDIFT